MRRLVEVFMIFRYRLAGVIIGLAVAAGLGIEAQAAGIGSGLGSSLSGGIAQALTQETVMAEEVVKAAAETLWVGTPLEGYTNIAISKVEDNLNIRDVAGTDGKLVGKMRNDSACDVIGIEGEWAHIVSGEVEGYVKAEYLITGQEAVDKALELANAIAANAQIAVRQSKSAMRRGMQTDMNTGVAFEAQAFGLCFSTEDQKNAMKAFVNKEKLNGFKNR